MGNFENVLLQLRKLEADRMARPQMPPMVICAPATDGPARVISVLWSHHQEPWQCGCGIDPPPDMITYLRLYGCFLERDESKGEVIFRPNWSSDTRIPRVVLSAPQSEIYLDGSRHRVVTAGRRFGKSYQALAEMMRMSWRPGSDVWYVAPVYRQIKDTIWRELKRFTKPYRGGQPNESELSIDLAWGSRIAVRSGTNYDSLRGAGLNGIVVDEYADIAPQAWQQVLRPMLSERGGKALFVGTPKGRNHFYELAQKAKTEPGWRFFSYTTLEGGRVPAAEIDSARRDLDEKTFKQEYEASFENYGGLVYYAFEREKNVAEVTVNPLEGFCWALDFNVNPMASVICQIEDRSTPNDRRLGYRTVRLNVLDEIVIPNSNTYEACEVFLTRLRGFTMGRPVQLAVYGDASGHARKTAGKTDWSIVEECLARCHDVHPRYRIPSTHPAVRDRVNVVNSMICSHTGERRVMINPRCRQLITDFERVAWKQDANGNTLGELDKRDPDRTHVSDALGYLIEEEFGNHGFVGFHTTRII